MLRAYDLSEYTLLNWLLKDYHRCIGQTGTHVLDYYVKMDSYRVYLVFFYLFLDAKPLYEMSVKLTH